LAPALLGPPMKVHLEEALDIHLHGTKLPVTVSLDFETRRDQALSGIWSALAQALGGSSVAVPSAPPPPEAANGHSTNGAEVTWSAPDLDMRAYKSVHRVVAAIAKAGGKGLTIQEVIEKARVSSPPLYKMVKTDNPQGKYAAKHIRTTKMGRSTIVDLKAEGRKLASLVRAGQVPA